MEIHIDVNPRIDPNRSYYYRDILNEYNDELKSGHLSIKLIEALIHIPTEIDNWEINDLQFRILNIYNWIFRAKYIENTPGGLIDGSCINTVIRDSIIIREMYLGSNEDRLPSICQAAFNEARSIYLGFNPKLIIPESIDEDNDFNPEHLSDPKFLVEFLLNNFSSEGHLKERASEIWKFI